MAFRSKLVHRERRTLMIGAMVLMMIGVYQFIWLPLVGKVQGMRKQVRELETIAQNPSLRGVRDISSVIAKSAKRDEAIQHHQSPAMLLSHLQERINAAHLDASLTRLTQISNDQVELRFRRVDFDSFISLITQTVTRQSVSIDSFSVEATDASGIVNANLILKV